jgi:hypothetical protein
MRRVLLPLVVIATALSGRGLAVSPVPETSILWQGTPILLLNESALLMCRCDSATGKDGVDRSCVTERLDMVGAVLERLPTPHGISETVELAPVFQKTYLEDRPRMPVNAEFFWRNLQKTLPVEGRRLTLRIAKSVLTCSEPGLPIERRDLGCSPTEVAVYETNDSAFFHQNHDPLHPVVVVGTCHPDALTTHQVVAVCGAAVAARQHVQVQQKPAGSVRRDR